jgi:hypothetical protein
VSAEEKTSAGLLSQERDESISKPEDSNRRIVAIVTFFLVCLIYSLWVVSIGWDHTITDYHGFRQTQTAISVEYMIGNAPTLAYETPVFGPPWSIPFEFPLYQWLVAGVVDSTGTSLVEAGRYVSVAFFLLSLIPGYLILRQLEQSPAASLVVLSLVLISPFYLFWSRTFMIESTALFFSLTYLAASMGAVEAARPWLRLAAMLFGIMAAVVKITTFAIFLVAVVVLIARRLKAGRVTGRQPWARLLGELLFLAVVPVAFGVLWTRFADAQKALNPQARFLVSSELHAWAFGTLEQRLSPETWKVILRGALLAVDPLVLAGGLLAVVATAGATRRLRGYCLSCLGLYLLGPLLFMNLHSAHEYYAYSNALFLVVAAGLGLAALANGNPLARRIGLVLLPLVFGLEYFRHRDYYLPIQQTNFVYFANLGQVIEQGTQEAEILLTIGLDWSPEVPFYSRRRALMIRGTPQEGLTRLEAALDQLAEYTPGAVVVSKTGVEPVSAADLEKEFAKRGWRLQEIFADDNVVVYRIR